MSTQLDEIYRIGYQGETSCQLSWLFMHMPYQPLLWQQSNQVEINKRGNQRSQVNSNTSLTLVTGFRFNFQTSLNTLEHSQITMVVCIIPGHASEFLFLFLWKLSPFSHKYILEKECFVTTFMFIKKKIQKIEIFIFRIGQKSSQLPTV